MSRRSGDDSWYPLTQVHGSHVDVAAGRVGRARQIMSGITAARAPRRPARGPEQVHIRLRRAGVAARQFPRPMGALISAVLQNDVDYLAQIFKELQNQPLSVCDDDENDCIAL